MALPVSPKDIIRFTPEGAEGVVYFLRPASVLDRAKFKREMTAAGITFHRREALAKAAREALIAAAPENVDDLIAIVDDVANGSEDKKSVVAWVNLTQKIAHYDPLLREMLSDNELYNDAAPLIAASLFLTGWEGIDVPFRRELDGRIPDHLLQQLPVDHLDEIGYRAIGLMFPTREQEKNSEPPQPSSSSPATSTAAKPRRTVAKDGGSDPTSIPETQD